MIKEGRDAEKQAWTHERLHGGTEAMLVISR